MISAIFIALGLLAGWAVTVAIAATVTMAVGAAAPWFVVTDYHTVRFRFKVMESLVWLAGATLGGFATAWIVGQMHPWVGAALLIAAMIAVLWRNSWEAHQRGLAMQILMTMESVIGVVTGFVLKSALIKT